MTDYAKGKIIPFKQGASFYMKRGAKKMEKNDLLSALSRYRQAYLSAPEEAEPCIAMSEILSQMQRFEESNRLLLLLIGSGNGTPECYFGLACNYFGMRDFDYAAENLENYLDADPDGPFALDAEDFLDLIDDDDAMFETTGLRTDQDYDDSAACVFARNLMNAGDFAGAVAELRRQTVVSPDSLPVLNQLAIASFCNGDRAGARDTALSVLTKHPEDNLARCTLALCLHDSGDEAGARALIDAAAATGTEIAEELNNISLLHMELRQYEAAAGTLRKLLTQIPYDENALHRYGYCLYVLGDGEGAQDCYKRLLKIHPGDAVAQYYLAQSRRTGLDERTVCARWMAAYQVPFSEALRRLNQINRHLSLPTEELLRLWQNDPHFVSLVEWALTLPEQRVKKSMLSLLYSFHDQRAERMLREFLLHTDQPDDLKRVVFGMLKRTNAPEPYMAYLSGRWIQGRVDLLEFPYKLPAAYENVAQLLLQYMVGVREENCVSVAARIYHKYIDSLNRAFPRITGVQALSMAGALEYLACQACEIPVTPEEIQEAYRISGTRLRNALVKLTPFAQGVEVDK